jgi:hypothetical protein
MFQPSRAPLYHRRDNLAAVSLFLPITQLWRQSYGVLWNVKIVDLGAKTQRREPGVNRQPGSKFATPRLRCEVNGGR